MSNSLIFGGTIWLREDLYREFDNWLGEGKMLQKDRQKIELLFQEWFICGPIKIEVYRKE